MHEAGVAARALEGALEAAREVGRGVAPSAIRVTFDPRRVTEDSLRFHMELALGQAGLAGLPIQMEPLVVECPSCGARVPGEAWPLCESCGAVVPAGTGPMAEARFEP